MWANPLLWVLVAALSLGAYAVQQWRTKPKSGSAVGGATASGKSAVNRHAVLFDGGGGAYALAKDGTVWTWGSTAWRPEGDKVYPLLEATPIPGVDGIVALSSGHTVLALRHDGSVWTAGWLPEVSFEGTPNPVKAPAQAALKRGAKFVRVQGISDAVAVAAGHRTMYAVKKDGTVWAWGMNGWGQFGPNVPLQAQVLVPQPIPAPPLTRQLHASGDLTDWSGLVAVTEPGDAWAWGHFSHLDIAHDEVKSQESELFLTPRRHFGLEQVTTMSMDRHSLDNGAAVHLDGTVTLWGTRDSICGQKGSSEPWRGNAFGHASTVHGGLFPMVQRSDGSVWEWGYDARANCTDAPRMVFGPGVVHSVTEGNASHALLSDGTVKMWGGFLNVSRDTPGYHHFEKKNMQTVTGLPPLR